MRTLLLAVLSLTLAIGCGGQRACTQEFIWGLSVTVVDGATGATRCDARVTISDGAYHETLSQPPSFDGGTLCFYLGAQDRPGTYTIDASAGGREKTLTNIVLPSDGCHAKGQSVTIVL